ncbi:MAG: hypothetical protein WAQ53_12055 [Thiofilum sp.]|uniref:hypothetical protein n=1 Tax=Thiofilum sp. TaxID=2212733 RepID=UPI0025D380ED|nr:hypothetical protein [Thiofilum sp.]MBK8454251.1 hypothetical protein [Thiofilum sp.]
MIETNTELLKRWASLPEQSINFVKDGVIDKNKWDKVNCKVLLLLKEAYSDKSPKGFDLCLTIRDKWKGIKKDGRDNTWINAALWCYVAQTLSSITPDPDKNNPILNDALLQAAVINVKKSGGKSSSDMVEIAAIAKRDGDLIKRQIAILEPNVVICGNTWKAVKHLYPDAIRVFPRVWFVNGVYFINFWHPANQFPRDLNYFSLVTLLREKEIHRVSKNSF